MQDGVFFSEDEQDKRSHYHSNSQSERKIVNKITSGAVCHEFCNTAQ